MTWKSVLVHCKAYSEWSPTIDVAIGLAGRHGASLTGLYSIRELAMLKLMFGHDHPSVREAEARDAPLTASAEARFREACGKAGIACDWTVGEGLASELVALCGRVHDLVVVAQSPAGLDGLTADVVEESAVSCGTPVLIVPRAGPCKPVGKRIVVAWNHSRQSAVALNAALPMIERAEAVTVLLGKPRDLTSSVTRQPKHDVAEHVRRHAGSARVDVVPFESDDRNAGSGLLDAVRNVEGDVLVMGAYGRSSWREFLLGGATRDVIANLDVPVLMAH